MVVTPATEQAVTELKLAAEIALRFPRDEEVALRKMLGTCASYRFADDAIWERVQGRKKITVKTDHGDREEWVDNIITGFSIRFAEELARVWRHIRTTTTVVFDDENSRAVSVSVWDCESNASYSEQVFIKKTVTRRSKKGRIVVDERLNSDGQTVFEVRATDDEINTTQANLVSKAIRNMVLRLVPAHVKMECWDACEKTMRDYVASQPEVARKRLVDAFAGIGVSIDALTEYMGCAPAEATDDQVVDMRKKFAAINAGAATWADFAEPDAGPKKPAPARGSAKRQTKASDDEHAGRGGNMDKVAETRSGTSIHGAIVDTAREILPDKATDNTVREFIEQAAKHAGVSMIEDWDSCPDDGQRVLDVLEGMLEGASGDGKDDDGEALR